MKYISASSIVDPSPPRPTRWFRDRVGLRALARTVRRRPKTSSNEPFRIWVSAGSVGDDAFSAALMLLTALPRRGSGRRLRVFATARDAAAVHNARHAFYDGVSV